MAVVNEMMIVIPPPSSHLQFVARILQLLLFLFSELQRLTNHNNCFLSYSAFGAAVVVRVLRSRSLHLSIPLREAQLPVLYPSERIFQSLPQMEGHR